jgi:hypothetical protein
MSVNISGRTVSLILIIMLISVNLGWACPEGDLSGDCKVDIADLVIFSSQWLDSVGCVLTWRILQL